MSRENQGLAGSSKWQRVIAPDSYNWREMSNSSQAKFQGALRVGTALLFLSLALIFKPTMVHAQQSYVSRYDLFAGYSFLDSPSGRQADHPVLHRPLLQFREEY